ncbi:hypothetical protein Btru_067723 [Bulinus truncatus]|nr:hypothetical protein Btru_067723 [Bulinus truncatus]
MSQIMEKTFASLPKLLTQTLIGGKSTKPPVQQIPSKEVQIFMNFVHRARSKTHEAAVVHSELTLLQQKLKQADLSASPSLIKNAFTKAIFCHLLGYDVSFIVIHAVNLAQQGKGFDKRLGYLLCCLLLHPHHEMVILIMATLLRDLKTSNMGDNCFALLVAGQLVSEENIPTILPEVFRKLNHSSDLVKEKALYCIRAFYQRAPVLMQSSVSQLISFLESRDPGILSAVVNIFLLLVNDNPSRFINLANTFLYILQQINERGFGTSYYYRMVPLPWLQINLIKILGVIGSIEPKLEEPISAKIQMLIEKTKVTEPISLAILVESILTATKINANDQLLQLCSRCIGKLLSAEAGNAMRYQGLGLLISLSRLKASFAAQHQMAVIECLSDDDHAIQLRTTYLLHAMANKSNIKAICVKLFHQIHKTKDRLLVNDIVHMISDLAERLSPGMDWYIKTYFNILDLELTLTDQDHYTEQVLCKLEQFFQNDQSVPEDVLKNFIGHILDALNHHNPLHPKFVLTVQIIGAFAPQLGSNLPIDRFLETVEKLLLKQDMLKVLTLQDAIPNICVKHSSDLKEVNHFELSEVKCYCLTTTMKLVLAGCLDLLTFKSWFQRHDYRKCVKDTSVLCHLEEIEEFILHPELLDIRSKIMFHPKNVNIDLSLSFLDNLVVQDLLQDQEPYKPEYIKSVHKSRISEKDSERNNYLSPSDLETGSFNNSHTSLVKQNSLGLKNKWRMVDEDQYLVVSEEETSQLDADKKKKEEMAKELFIGLNDANSINTTPINESFKNIKLNNRQLWQDDEDIGLHLNPFGLSKKVRLSQTQRWFDEDLDTDNARSFSLDNFISNQLERVDSPETQMHSAAGLDLRDSLLCAEESGYSDYVGIWYLHYYWFKKKSTIMKNKLVQKKKRIHFANA